MPHVGDAPDLRVEEVVRVVDDALKVGLAEAHPLTVREWKGHVPRG
jgi:hypothetical protein